MLFSIITVCFNSEKTIEKTIQSVWKQSYQDFEYILVDGASTDRTLEIIHKYEPMFEGRMKLISEKDRGIYDAMNKGILASSGKLIGMVNSDDYYEQDALDKVAQAYEEQEYAVIYGMLRTVSRGREVMVYIKNHEFLEDDMITHPTCFVTKKAYEKFGLYSLKYNYSADYEFMLRLKQQKEVKFIKIYSIISNFNLDGSSGTTQAYRETLKLKHEMKLISNRTYYIYMIKSWIAMILGR